MLLENKSLKIFSIQERRKSKYKFVRTKVCKAEKVRKYFVNPKIETEVFSSIICNLDSKNTSCPLFLYIETMNGVMSWYILALHYLFYFIACVLFLSIYIYFFFLVFYELCYLLRYLGKFGGT